MKEEFVVEMEISDEIGNDFRARVTMHIEEIRAALRPYGYVVRKR